MFLGGLYATTAILVNTTTRFVDHTFEGLLHRQEPYIGLYARRKFGAKFYQVSLATTILMLMINVDIQ